MSICHACDVVYWGGESCDMCIAHATIARQARTIRRLFTAYFLTRGRLENELLDFIESLRNEGKSECWQCGVFDGFHTCPKCGAFGPGAVGPVGSALRKRGRGRGGKTAASIAAVDAAIADGKTAILVGQSPPDTRKPDR